MRSILYLLALMTFTALAGCAGDAPIIVPPTTASRRPAPPPATATPAFQAIGSDAGTLTAQFGKPALDQREGPARKLQFRSATCVLDAYLYPPAGGGTPRVTWIDTRNSQGVDTDRTACITALARR